MSERVEQVMQKCPGQLMPSLWHLTYEGTGIVRWQWALAAALYIVDDTRNDMSHRGSTSASRMPRH